jgi:hypothetical protein
VVGNGSEFDDGKPSEEVRQALKDGDFRRNNNEMVWEKDVRFETRAQDRHDARTVFDEVADASEEFGAPQER